MHAQVAPAPLKHFAYLHCMRLYLSVSAADLLPIKSDERAGGLPKTKHFPAEIQRVEQINRKLLLKSNKSYYAPTEIERRTRSPERAAAVFVLA